MTLRMKEIRAEAMKALERIRVTLEATGELERGQVGSEAKPAQGQGKARQRRSR